MVKQRLQTIRSVAGRIVLSAALAVMTMPLLSSYAGDTAGGLESYDTKNAKDLTNNLIKVICNLMTYVGALTIVVGVIQVIMAFRNEDADGKQRGMLVAVCGIALCSIQSIMKLVGFSI